ncbi:hypothetical protein BY996DRAFT_4582898 [Phakopsora pachyrhizi]|nr:hypothetical protein BY996DRAFT_4582898 [Phakopsora pachyrhizi]
MDEGLRISREDQLRLINQTGILGSSLTIDSIKPSKIVELRQESLQNKSPLLKFSDDELMRSDQKVPSDLKSLSTRSDSQNSDEVDQQLVDDGDSLPVWVDETFDTILYAIPFNTVFICLDVAIHAQYGQPLTITDELSRLKNVIPTSLLFIYLTLTNRRRLTVQSLLFMISNLTGSYMIYVINRSSYLLVMRRTPGLGCLWIYCVVLMDLRFAVCSLTLIGAWCWIMNLSLYA